MKVVVVEIKDKYAAALSDDGNFIKIKNKNYYIGQEIILSKNNRVIKFVASAAAALVLLVTPAWAYLTPYSYVSLDINPSFEFSINRFDRVLEVKAVNNDGESIVEEISIKNLRNKEIEEAVKNVLDELKSQGYIQEGKAAGVVIATSSKSQEKTDNLSAAIKATVEKEVDLVQEEDLNEINEIRETEVKKTEVRKESQGLTDLESEAEVTKDVEVEEYETKSNEVKEGKSDDEVEKEYKKEIKKAEKELKKKEKDDAKKAKSLIEVIEVSKEDVNKAKIKGVTPGKLNLVEKLHALSPNIDVDDWLNKPVKDIVKEINKIEKQIKKEENNKKDNKEKEDNKGNNKEKESNKDNKYKEKENNKKEDKSSKSTIKNNSKKNDRK